METLIKGSESELVIELLSTVIPKLTLAWNTFQRKKIYHGIQLIPQFLIFFFKQQLAQYF